MYGRVSKYLLSLLIAIAAFYFVKENPAVAWILSGSAAAILFFFRSREAIILYSLYFAFEETILLHAPSQFLVLLKYLGDILILAVFFATFAKLTMRRYDLSPVQQNSIHIPIFLFLLCAFASSLVNSIPLHIAFITLRQMLRYIVLFYAILLTAPSEWTRDDLRILIKIILGLVIIQMVIGYFQILFGPGSALNTFLSSGNEISLFEGLPIAGGGGGYAEGKSVYGTMISPNTYGLFLTGGFCLLLGVYLMQEKPRSRRLFFLLCALMFTILRTASRQSVYACLLGILVLGILQKNFKIILFTICILMAASYYLKQSKESYRNLYEMGVTQKLLSMLSPQYRAQAKKTERFYAFQQILPKILKSRYAALGLGPGAIGSPFGFYLRYFEGYKKLNIPTALRHTTHTGTADVGFVAIIGQFGILGMIAFFGIFVLLFRDILVKELPYITDPFYKGITMGFLAYISALLFSNVGYANFSVRQVSFYFWILAGVILSLRKVKESEKEIVVPSYAPHAPLSDRGRPGPM